MADDKEGRIDLDEERIFVNGEWLSEEELKYAIKTKVSSDDFDIAPIATALKSLEAAIQNSRVIEVRFSNEMADKLEDMAKRKGENVGVLIRGSTSALIDGDIDLPEGAGAPVTEKKSSSKDKKKKEEEEEPEEEEPEDEEDEEEEPEEEEPEDEEDEEEEPEEEESEDEEDEDDDSGSRRRSSRRGGRRRRRKLD